jgi:hypothetical protein
MIDAWDLNGLIEVFALDPVLEFAGRIAAVFAGLVCGDDQDFGADRIGCVANQGIQKKPKCGNQGTTKE